MTSGVSFAFLQSLDPRDPTGFGNNLDLAKAQWGNAEGFYVRITPNSYGDGTGSMEPAPIAREISNAVLAQPDDVNLPTSFETNEFFQFFGQFLTHDITEAPGGTGSPINIGGGLGPIQFTRTPGKSDSNGVRQQQTGETSFLDLSTVYGVRPDMLDMLRVGVDGGSEQQSAKLLTGIGNTLPTFQNVADDSGVPLATVRAINNGVTAFGGFDSSLFVSGDDRTNQSAALITHQTMWMREHNFQVDRLSVQFPTWTQNQLFEAARAITEAEWQHVVYSEYLTKLVGQNALSAYDGYKANINPGVINEFATVAFRFGHDQSSNSFDTLAENGAPTGSFTLASSFALANASQAIRTNGAMDDWVRGQLSHQTQEIDGKIVNGNRNLLFGDPNGSTIDLTVLDIQRGRDHGVGDYNTLRAGLGLGTYATFDAFALDNNVEAATLAALKLVYGDDISKLDSVIGGLLEKHFLDSQLGETFTILTVRQFENLRDGDRFYFENRFQSSPDLINEIKTTSLADIISRTTGIEHVYHDAFAAHDRIGGTAGADTLLGSDKKDLIIGGAGDDVALGGSGDDDIYGDDGDDQIFGEAGNDHLFGGAGRNTLVGGAGDDTYRVNNSSDVVTELAGGGLDAVVTSVNYSLSTFVENLIAAAGFTPLSLIGNDLDNTLVGNDGANVLVGGAGADTMIGNAGDDVYHADQFDAIVEQAGGGIDTVVTIANFTLGAFLENLVAAAGTAPLSLTGNDLDNTLVGNDGANAMSGGSGNDTYYVGQGDTVEEGANGGIDTVITALNFALGAFVENLVATAGTAPLSLTGNELDNTLVGNDGANVLVGNVGADAMIGNAGDDVYYADQYDAIVEQGGGGVDTVVTGVSFNLGAFVENLIASPGTSALTFAGNELNNTLTGNDESNVLIGNAGADTMIGNAGDDVYYADQFDTIIEHAGGGYDTIISSVSINVAANVEKLVVMGSGSTNFVGNNLANTLVGGSGANKLSGGGGRDILKGGLGRDTLTGGGDKDFFVFDTKADKARKNVDKIVDFSVKNDTFWFDNKYFAKLGKSGSEAKPAKLKKDYFAIDSAKDANDYLIYDSKKGHLMYDADGSGKGAAVYVASLSKHLKMTYHDFYVI